ncbi:MAG: HDOD domain-containing protein [Planctomycetia bacterium]|nr:HDOD domain-containing protein [Planctomycetia bacterium]
MTVDWNSLVQNAMKVRPQLDLPRRLKLPVLPQSVVEFTAISEKPDVGPQELAAPIEADSALTSELLRQVNSVGTGLRQRVSSVAQAINLFGPRRTKTLVLTCALQTAKAGMKSQLINATQFQKENRIRAIFAREAARGAEVDIEVAYTAGLLQDFLLPLLTDAFHSDYQKLFQEERELVEKERERFGWDHAQIAAGLMHDWGFPGELVASVLLHHSLDQVTLDPALRESTVSAAIAAAALPDCLCQSPQGFETLLFLQDVLPDFCFLEVANLVDEELAGADGHRGQETTLCERLGNLAIENLEQRRIDRVHRHKQLGNYTLEEQIGEGGMGVVYRARHCMLKRPAAVKLLHSMKLGPDSLARFESEVQLTCQLTSPHTIAVYDYGVTAEGLFYYAMEYLDGINLGQLVRDYGPQSSGRVIHLLQQACSSLAEAHAAGLIHRDLKPDNLMLCYRGGIPDMLKVLDFGLARVVSDHPERDQLPQGLSGTPHYMPPEAISTPNKIDARSDLYSLGAVAYCLLTGLPVFSGDNILEILRQHSSVVPKSPSERLGIAVDADLEAIVMQCLAKQPTDRPKNAQELSRMLSHCESATAWGNEEAADWWSRREAFIRTNGPTSPGAFEPTRVIGI